MADHTKAPLKAAKSDLTIYAATDTSKTGSDAWQATEDDWAYLKATRTVRVWQLVALACGVHPRASIANQLPPEVKARYLRLRKTVRGSLTREPRSGGLLCDPKGINAGSSADTMPVALSDFVAFMDAGKHDVDPRMRQIADSARALSTELPIEATNQSLDRSIEINRIRIDRSMRTEDVTRRLKSIAKLLLAVAVHDDGYKYDVSKLGMDGKTLKGMPSKVFAALSATVAASGLGTMDGETVREALWFAIDMSGRDEVMERLMPKKA